MLTTVPGAVVSLVFAAIVIVTLPPGARPPFHVTVLVPMVVTAVPALALTLTSVRWLPVSPANTTTDDPVVVLLPVDVDCPEVAALMKPVLVTVAVSPLSAFTHVFFSVSVACLRVFVSVQVTAVSAPLMVNVLPASAVALPVQLRTAV